MGNRTGPLRAVIRGETFLHAAMAECAPRLASAFSDAIQRAVNPTPAQIALDKAEDALKLAAANVSASSNRVACFPEDAFYKRELHNAREALTQAAVAWGSALSRCPER